MLKPRKAADLSNANKNDLNKQAEKSKFVIQFSTVGFHHETANGGVDVGGNRLHGS
jgi:hypothetical protein